MKMKHSRAWMACIGLALLGTGCATSYTGISRINENTYVITKVKMTMFGARGEVLSCTPSGDNFRCTEIE